MKFAKLIEWTVVRTPLAIILVVVLFGVPVYLLGNTPCVVFMKEEKAAYVPSDTQTDYRIYVYEDNSIGRYPVDSVSVYDNENNLTECEFHTEGNRLYIKLKSFSEDTALIRIRFSDITILEEIFRSK